MAYPFATLTYATFARGVSPTALIAAMQSVPTPESILEEFGCYVTADSTVDAGGGKVTRTVSVSAVSSGAATATPNRAAGYSSGPIVSVTVNAPGAGFVRPPIAQVFESAAETLPQALASRGKGARLQAYLGIVGRAPTATQIAVGAGYSAATVAGLVGGLPGGTNRVTQARPGFGAVDPLLWTGTTGCGVRVSDPPASVALNTLGCVRAVSVKNPGIGYTPATTKIVWVGAVPIAGGRLPIAFPTFDAMGRCTSVTMVDPGCGYVTTPVPMLVDTSVPGGRGCVLKANMMRGHSAALSVTVLGGQVVAVPVTDPGDGYVSMPTLVIYDPTGGGSGASYTVAPIPGTPSLFGVSRIDVLSQGSGYVAPVITVVDVNIAWGEVAIARGTPGLLLNQFANLMKTALQNQVGSAITETLA